jgi:hypothetical protein
MRKLLALVLAAAFSSVASAQTVAPAAVLTDSAQALVRGSREAILKTGISDAYFDAHFRVERVVDTPGDRRVVWKFSVGGYEATVADAVGFYTEGGRRFDTHSVAGTLGSTRDITRTLTRRRAADLMRRCIGRFTDPRVEYRAHSAGGAAALLLTAQGVAPAPRTSRARREREERGARERLERARRGAAQGDSIEEEDEGDDRPAIVLGAVDLVTGECLKGRALAGPERAAPLR